VVLCTKSVAAASGECPERDPNRQMGFTDATGLHPNFPFTTTTYLRFTTAMNASFYFKHLTQTRFMFDMQRNTQLSNWGTRDSNLHQSPLQLRLFIFNLKLFLVTTFSNGEVFRFNRGCCDFLLDGIFPSFL